MSEYKLKGKFTSEAALKKAREEAEEDEDAEDDDEEDDVQWHCTMEQLVCVGIWNV